MKRLNKVKIEWSPHFAYAIGLLATDGNLSKDGRHINMTSKDKEVILMFKECLGVENKIGRKSREKSKIKKYFQIQFGDTNFYNFLLSIGLKPAKSKTLNELVLPSEYLADFLRGCIDGDGNIDIHSHPESQHPQLRIRFNSASLAFIKWIKKEIFKSIKPKGGWIENYSGVYTLNYGKNDAMKLLNFIYYPKVKYYLNRKYMLAKQFLGR